MKKQGGKMKSKNIVLLLFIAVVLIVTIFVANKYNGPSSEKGKMLYTEAINKVYQSNITGMAVVVCKTSNLSGNDAAIFLSAAGNKDNGFSANNAEGVKIWSAKQLFMQIQNLKALREGSSDTIGKGPAEYYIIQTNNDYLGKQTEIRYLDLFVNPDNYHIFMPKDYYEPDKLKDINTTYVEYEPNEITKMLIDNILKQ
jgi:hypothetical protein